MRQVMYDFKKLFFENPDIKALVASLMVYISWSFNGEYHALAAIYTLVVFDFLTGTYYSLYSKTWNSRRSISGVVKFFRYLVYMMIARMIDKVVPLPFASPVMDTYIVITEAGSILENFSKLGYPVPTMFLDKLKSFYAKKN